MSGEIEDPAVSCAASGVVTGWGNLLWWARSTEGGAPARGRSRCSRRGPRTADLGDLSDSVSFKRALVPCCGVSVCPAAWMAGCKRKVTARLDYAFLTNRSPCRHFQLASNYLTRIPVVFLVCRHHCLSRTPLSGCARRPRKKVATSV